MVGPDTYTLELGILAAASISIAIAGVAFIQLRPRAGGAEVREEAGRIRRAILSVVAFRLTFGSALLGGGVAAVLWTLRPTWATQTELSIGFSAGIVGGVVTGLWGARVASEVLRLGARESALLPRETPIGAGLAGGVAVIAGAAGIALGTLGGLFIGLGGHVPALGSAILGAGLAELAARPSPSKVDGGANQAPESGQAVPARTVPGTPSMGPLASPVPIEASASSVAAGVFSSFLLVGSGAALVAFAPSVIRVIVPNAVGFPFLALSITFLTSLVAVPAAVAFSSGGETPPSLARALPTVVALCPSVIAVLYLDGAFLAQNIGLLAGLVGGPVGGGLLLAHRSIRRGPGEHQGSSNDGPPPGRSSIRPVVAASAAGTAAMFGILAASYVLGGWTGSGSQLSIDASLGTYGVALAAVGMVAFVAGSAAVQLGRSFAALIPADLWSPTIPGASSTEPTYGGEPSASTGVGLAELVGVGLGAWVLLGALILLVPVQSGFSPALLVMELRPGSPRLIGGALVGALLLWGGNRFQSRILDRPLEGRKLGSLLGRETRVVFSRTIPYGAVTVALPLIAGWLLGWVGLVGLLGGATVTATVLGGVWGRSRPPSEEDSALAAVRTTLLIVSAVALLFGGWLLQHSGIG